MRYGPDGSGEEIFARGLRNAVGIAFHPSTGELWATNNGRDGMGDDVPPETINVVTQGADFGWPRCHAGNIVDADLGREGACDGVAPPAVEMQAHSAPLGLTFTSGSSLGAEWDGALFVAFHGSWDRTTPTGYKVVALPLENGVPTGEVLDFATGWLLPNGEVWGRPVDVLQAPDGSLLVSDDTGGRIFRIHPLGQP
jgi:glucose/arabinose dehydrogenase